MVNYKLKTLVLIITFPWFFFSFHADCFMACFYMLLQFQIYIEVSHLSEKVMEEEVMKSQLCHELSFVDYLWETNFAKDIAWKMAYKNQFSSLFIKIHNILQRVTWFSDFKATLWFWRNCEELMYAQRYFIFFKVMWFYFFFFFSHFIYGSLFIPKK